MPAHELKAAIATFMRVNKNTKMTGFQEQFDVRAIKYKYRMAGNFGGEFILADWRF